MSRDAAKFLILHLMAIALFFGCLLNAGEGWRQFYSFFSGVMLWPVIETARDFYKQVKTDLKFD